MRLISQDRKIDIPYENSAVYILANYDYNKEIKYDITGYKITTCIGDNYWDLGVYSTEEKALRVMEMLQQQYMRYLTTVLSDAKSETTYFKFPADESANDVFA